jgi:anthranilate phosphoribosyltransferase
VEKVISPADFGLVEHPLSSVRGGPAEKNAQIMNDLLDGKIQEGPVLDFVLLNSAALLYISGKASSLPHGVTLARKSIFSGEARKQFDAFRIATQ